MPHQAIRRTFKLVIILVARDLRKAIARPGDPEKSKTAMRGSLSSVWPILVIMSVTLIILRVLSVLKSPNTLKLEILERKRIFICLGLCHW